MVYEHNGHDDCKEDGSDPEGLLARMLIRLVNVLQTVDGRLLEILAPDVPQFLRLGLLVGLALQINKSTFCSQPQSGLQYQQAFLRLPIGVHQPNPSCVSSPPHCSEKNKWHSNCMLSLLSRYVLLRRSAINKEELRGGAKTAEVCLDGAPRRDRRSRSDRPLGEGKEKSSRSEEQSVDRLRARQTTV